MTIDERLEALTQSLELTAGLQRATEINVSKLSDAMTRLSESQAKTEKMVRGFGRYAMAIARDHEEGLFNLENPAT